MRQFNVLLQKEWREVIRSKKLIWVPLVFLSLGVSDPLSNYFMEDILNAVGNMPEGFEMLMPELQPNDLMQATMGQFQLIGLIVLISIFVGSISRERQNGTAALLYVRPLSFSAYYMSKLTIAWVLAVISMLLGFAGSAYYTTILYGALQWDKLVGMLAMYAIWLLFVLSFTLTMSAFFTTTVAVAIAIVVFPMGLLIDSLIGSYWTYIPYKLPVYSIQFLRDDVNIESLVITLIITIVATILLMFLGIFGASKNKHKVKY